MDSPELAFAGPVRLTELLRAREVSSPELVELFVGRIEALEPRINAFTKVLAESAAAEAERAQARLDAGEASPLLGVPVAVKDNVDVAGEVTSHGTGAAGGPAVEDSEVIGRLRSAGAVILGKTALPELAQWGHFTDSITWGTTRNPWDPDRSPGGSSGGSAAAVAAGMAPVALASDGGASIRVPAGMCGLFGLKPQRGRVSLAPDPEHWHGLTMLGGVARSVLDGAVFLDVIAGPASEQPFADAARAEPARLRIAVSTKPVLKPVRLGAEQRAAVEGTAELLRSLGHEVRERDPRYSVGPRTGLPRYLSGIHDDAARLAHPERLERRTRSMMRLGRLTHGRELRRALAKEGEVSRRINAIFDEHDVLLTPLVAQPAPRAERWHDKGALRTFLAMTPYITYTTIWNYTGQPAAAVPAGLDGQGLPLAVQLVGRPNAEASLISLAAQIEAARPWANVRPPLNSWRAAG